MIDWLNGNKTVIATIWRKSRNGVVSTDNEKLLEEPSEVVLFKRLTTSFPDVSPSGLTHCLVSRPTYEAFPGQVWANRQMYILTSDKKYKPRFPSRQTVINDIEDVKLLKGLEYNFAPVLFVVGGISIFSNIFNTHYLKPNIIIENIYQKDALLTDDNNVIFKPDISSNSEFPEILQNNIITKIHFGNNDYVLEKAGQMYNIANLMKDIQK